MSEQSNIEVKHPDCQTQIANMRWIFDDLPWEFAEGGCSTWSGEGRRVVIEERTWGLGNWYEEWYIPAVWKGLRFMEGKPYVVLTFFPLYRSPLLLILAQDTWHNQRTPLYLLQHIKSLYRKHLTGLIEGGNFSMGWGALSWTSDSWCPIKHTLKCHNDQLLLFLPKISGAGGDGGRVSEESESEGVRRASAFTHRLW